MVHWMNAIAILQVHVSDDRPTSFVPLSTSPYLSLFNHPVLMPTSTPLLDTVQFDEGGLVPAVVQDAETDQVLMLAYMTAETLRETLDTGRMVYWSRSREERWVKGATSGHTQTVEEVRVDCDGDTLLFLVDQKGGACHTGHRSCFYRRSEDEGLVTDEEKVFSPEAVYGETE